MAKKGKQLLTKLGMKDGWIGSEQSEGKPVHQMGMGGVVGKIRRSHRSQFGTGEQLLTKLGMKEWRSESVQIEGKTIAGDKDVVKEENQM